jgi:hypothetical protein
MYDNFEPLLILQNIDDKFLFHGNHLLNRLLAGTPTTAAIKMTLISITVYFNRYSDPSKKVIEFLTYYLNSFENFIT